MQKKFSLFAVLAVILVVASCTNSSNFKVEKGKVGKITSQTKIHELEKLFANDSIVKKLSEGTLGTSFSDDDEYLIYEKGGKHLLTVIPKEQLDSTSTIQCVEIHDDRYATDSGLNLNSTFADINLSNRIDKVETSLSSATLFIDDINATVTISKEELGLRSFSFEKVSLEQIPDLAKMRSFIVWFN